MSETSDLYQLARPAVQALHPYLPGKPIEELERELGISNIVKLASNENPLGISPVARKAIERALDEGARYPDGNGFVLKHALKKYLNNNDGIQLELDQFTLGNGSNDVLDIIARCFADSESEVIFSQYAFAVYAISCQSVGAKAVVTPANSWGHDLQAMLDAVNRKTRLIFIANPNNPTGTFLEQAELEAFLKQLPESVVVVLDEAYCEYLCDYELPDNLSLLAKFPNLIITRTFSKAWGLASLRVGYAISHSDIADILNRVRHPFNVNSLALAAAASVLEDVNYLENSISSNRQGMNQIEDGLNKLGLSFIPSKGNFISFDTGCDGMEVYRGLLQLGVIVRPIGNYGMPSFLRVSIGLECENQRFLDALADVMSGISS